MPTLLLRRRLLLMWSHAARRVWYALLHRISMAGAQWGQGSRAPAEAVVSRGDESLVVVIVALGLMLQGLYRLCAGGEALLMLPCMDTVCQIGLRLGALAEASCTPSLMPRRVTMLERPPMLLCTRSRRTRIWVLLSARRSGPVKLSPCLCQLFLRRETFVLPEPSVVWPRYPTRHSVKVLAVAVCDWPCPLLLRYGPWAESSDRRASGTMRPCAALKSFRLVILKSCRWHRTPVLLGRPMY
jgi:hypothetical protein